MDWGQFDLEGAMRQRHADIEERLFDIQSVTRRGRVGAHEFREMYDISWLYHENGLEGVVLTYPEIKSAVDNKIISDISLLPTYNDIKNQKYCLDRVRALAHEPKTPLSIELLCELHGRLVVQGKHPHLWRKDIPIHRTYFHEIVQPQQIQMAVGQVLEMLNAEADPELHALELAARSHHAFMRAFPFHQGSGTIGRLLLNYVLLRGELLPIIVHASDRQRYYEALRGSVRDVHVFLAEAMENSLDNTLHFLRGQERVALRA